MAGRPGVVHRGWSTAALRPPVAILKTRASLSNSSNAFPKAVSITAPILQVEAVRARDTHLSNERVYLILLANPAMAAQLSTINKRPVNFIPKVKLFNYKKEMHKPFASFSQCQQNSLFLVWESDCWHLGGSLGLLEVLLQGKACDSVGLEPLPHWGSLALGTPIPKDLGGKTSSLQAALFIWTDGCSLACN